MPDLDSIPGVERIWAETQGDLRIKVAIIDGPADLEHACFQGAEIRQLKNYWLEEKEALAPFIAHSTHLASVVFAQPGTEVVGLAPRCSGIVVPSALDAESAMSELCLARGFDLAVEAGAKVIHCGWCLPNQSGQTWDVLQRSIDNALEQGVLIVAPAGNNHGLCYCVPAILPGVLPVGALSDEGQPMDFTNWGGRYQAQGIMGPGENVLGARPGGGSVRQKGTSVAAPVISGICALLLSLQLKRGQTPSSQRVREALIATATPCPDGDERCLAGVLNLPAAIDYLLGEQSLPLPQPVAAPPPRSWVEASWTTPPPPMKPAPRVGSLFALGQLDFDFCSEARRDYFRHALAKFHGGSGEPDNPQQMAAYLQAHPTEASRLMWILRIEDSPMYAVRPTGPFASDIYRLLIEHFAGRAERMSLPGQLTAKHQKTRTGRLLPVVESAWVRGMWAWTTSDLADSFLQPSQLTPPQRQSLERALQGFFNKVYYELANPGLEPPHRALNFAATRAFQASQVFLEALQSGFELANIEVVASPFCRPLSDCWDVKLKFFDAENLHRSRRVFRFTVDVSDILPVTLGEIQSWSTSD